MAITNPFSITYGSRSVGGTSSTYLLNGPYVIDKSFTALRLVFEVVVVSSSHGDLKTDSDNLEQDFSKRDQDLTISLDGSSWEYVLGENILNTRASLQKTGNKETDRGVSRAYTCVVEGELPASDNQGLREIEVNVDFAPSRQKTVTMRGQYTATDGTLASENYLDLFDAEATTILTAIDGDATWELVSESFNRDRLDHNTTFTRQYLQLLANQSATLDDAEIKDHRMTFTDLSQHPGDAAEGVHRLRRVIGTYDCAINIEETEDLQQVWTSKVKPHVLDLFETNFEPTVFAIEDSRISYDETSKRLSVSLQMLYQKAAAGEAVVEVSQSVAYRETRNIDYTPVHDKSEFAMEADPGWAVRERVWSRTVVCMGAETPKRRIGERANAGVAGLFDDLSGNTSVDTRNTGKVERDGWNIIQSTSQVTRQFVGDPAEGEQIEMSVLTESVAERYHIRPETTTQVSTTTGGA